jgi:hypothetical protein
MAAALLVLPGAQARGDQASVELSNGIHVHFSVEGPQPWGHGVYGYSGDIIMRGFTDPASCTYFGYEIAAKPADQGRIEVKLGPLSARGEKDLRKALVNDGRHPECTSPRAAAAAPRFPSPAVLADGDGLSIDLLANPKTGATLTDRIRVSMRPSLARLRSGEAVPDLKLDQLPFGVFPHGRLRIDGVEQPGGTPGCRGTIFFLWLPQRRERFVFSLVPRRGYDFRKVGVADGDRITFTWDGVRYEWIGEDPVVASDVRCPVWILKDEREPEVSDLKLGGVVCGSGGVDLVFGER